MNRKLTELQILIKGGGEVASGIAHRLFCAHFNVCLTETHQPQAVSRGVSFSEAIYDGEKEIEGVVAKLIRSTSEIPSIWAENKIPIIVDPEAMSKNVLQPNILIDAIMAKKNTGTTLVDADLVIGLGPGFRAGKDVHMVVETDNSERLGKVIFAGEAERNTGVPITIDNLASERVQYATDSGLFVTQKEMGEHVIIGEVIASVGREEVRAPTSGVIRAFIRSGIIVERGTKLVEIDPSASTEACYCIRARVRAISGGVLEAILIRFNV